MLDWPFNGAVLCKLTEAVQMFRGGYRAAATSKMELFVIIVNGFQPLTMITKHSILDVPVALDPPLMLLYILIIYTHSSIEGNFFVKLPQF